MNEPDEKQPPETKSRSRELLREWGFDVATFEARAKQSIKNSRGDLSEVTGALRQTLTTTKQTLIDLHKNRHPVAAELKTGFEKAWDEIERGFAGARRKVREAREAEATAGAKKSTDASPEE